MSLTPEQLINLTRAILFLLCGSDSPDEPLHTRNMQALLDAAEDARAQRIESGQQQSGVIDDTRES